MKTTMGIFLAVFSILILFASEAIAANGQREEGAADTESGVQLPLSRVVLFTSGVGYFQREGTVNGNAGLDLSFKTGDINDLLKSLVIQDLDGGRAGGVTYSSRDPLDRTLRSFAIDLTGDPGFAQILAQVRGETVELLTSQRITGTVIGVEEKPTGEHTASTFLNLLTDGGMRRVDLTEVRSVSFVNPRLQSELVQALSLLAESRSAEHVRVTLDFKGRGDRRVRVGYLLETPLWKTSYRLVLAENQEHFLQGWAIVENTTDEDWQDVSLSLVSGRPISFIMDLYRPLYVPRPTVEMELYSSILPQRYEEDLSKAAAEPEAPRTKERIAASRAAPKALQSFDLEESSSASELDLRQGVPEAAQAMEAGNFFRYLIQDSVSIPRQESAMLPIVNRNVGGRRVSIYNQSVQSKHPLHGLMLKNSTGYDLMGGPLTVFEQGSYAGDAWIDTLPSGAERLISYAVDLDTEIAVSSRSVPETLLSVRIVKGTLISTLSLRSESTYRIKNADDRPRAVLVEHPLNPDWDLVTPASAEETTRSAYRFLVSVEAKNTRELLVAVERKLDRSVLLTNLNEDQISYFISAGNVDRRIVQALEGLAERKVALSQTVSRRQEEERRVNSIHKEQSRIRENMARLERSSDLYKRYVSLLDEQEDMLEKALAGIEDLRIREMQQQEELNRYILSIDLP